MQADIQACYEKLKKKVAKLEQKDANLREYCRERFPIDLFGCCRWIDEYEKRHAKIQQELEYLRFYEKIIYDVHLTAVERGIEKGSYTERSYLGMEEADDVSSDSYC